MNERPQSSEYTAGYAPYISLVAGNDIMATLSAQRDELKALLTSVPVESETFRYEASKWSVRQVAGHMADVERIFGYRAMAIARGDKASLPGFDERLYASSANFDAVRLRDLCSELDALRLANVLMLQNLRAGDWTRSGVADGKPLTTRAIAYVLAGHARHHIEVLKERYLSTL